MPIYSYGSAQIANTCNTSCTPCARIALDQLPLVKKWLARLWPFLSHFSVRSFAHMLVAPYNSVKENPFKAHNPFSFFGNEVLFLCLFFFSCWQWLPWKEALDPWGPQTIHKSCEMDCESVLYCYRFLFYLLLIYPCTLGNFSPAFLYCVSSCLWFMMVGNVFILSSFPCAGFWVEEEGK